MSKNLFLALAIILVLTTIFSACKKKPAEKEEPTPTPTESSQPNDNESPDASEKPSESPAASSEPGKSSSPSATPGKSSSPSATPAKSTEPSTTAPATNPSGEVPTDPKVLEFVEITRQEMERSLEGVEGGADITISARGNSVVHTFIYPEVLDFEAAKAEIARIVEASAEIYQDDLNILKSYNVSSPSIIIQHFDETGKLIFSREFK